jgi:hypothetical protein
MRASWVNDVFSLTQVGKPIPKKKSIRKLNHYLFK